MIKPISSVLLTVLCLEDSKEGRMIFPFQNKEGHPGYGLSILHPEAQDSNRKEGIGRTMMTASLIINTEAWESLQK